MPMPKNHRVYDYDYVAFARLVREGMDRLCLTRNRFGTLAALDTRTLDRVLAGRGVNDGVRQKVVDGLKRRSTQIKVALDFERLAAAARPGPHRYSRREAIRFSTAGFTVLAVETGNGPARSTRDDGLSVSPTSSTTAMALEKAQLALKFWESDAWDAGLKFCEESLVALGIVDFSPEQPAPISLREAEFRNRWGQSDYETALRAYAQLAQIYGFARHARGKFELAKRTYATWVDVSRLLGDGSMTADALRFLSRSTFEQAVHVEPEDVAWRVPRDPQSILRSIEIVGEAHSTRPKNDASHRVADDWRTEARYRQLVLVFARDIRALNQARHAWEEARAAISEDTSRANVHLLQDEARWHLSEVRISTARDVYQEALHIAPAIGSHATQSSLYAGLGTVYSMRASDYDSAVECCLASLLLWPSKFDSRDSDKSWHLFEQLDLSLNDVENFKDRDSQTGDVVLEQLGDEHDDRLRMVRARWSAYVAKSRRPANTA